MRERGWSTPLVWSTCQVCGRLVPSPAPIKRTVCRAEACRRAKIAHKARERTKDHPGQSTPYVREWRKRNPAKLLADRIHETDRWRGKVQPRTPEQRARYTVVANRGQRAKNERTRELAAHFGEPWSGDEDTYILAHPELTSAAIAFEHGRTYHAVRHRRALLRQRSNRPT